MGEMRLTDMMQKIRSKIDNSQTHLFFPHHKPMRMENVFHTSPFVFRMAVHEVNKLYHNWGPIFKVKKKEKLWYDDIKETKRAHSIIQL